jgi:predicted outer membrane repeat protein
MYVGAFTNITISDSVIINENSATVNGGGIIAGTGSTVEVKGDASINLNTADSIGGAIHNSGITTITGSAVIDGNTAGSSGGGIYGSNLIAGADLAQITNNTAGTSGGGIRTNGSNGKIDIANQVEISGNSVLSGSGLGGGICMTASNYGITLSGHVTIANNTTSVAGGGISLQNALSAPAIISDSVTFVNNTAGGNGGAIFVPYANLSSLTVAPAVTFSGNSAATSELSIAPVDQATYDSTILTTSFTSPFTQGYNNFDISYAAPRAVVNFDTLGGSVVASQTVLLGDTADKPAASPTKSDNNFFVDWFADETTTVAWSWDSTVSTDTTIYARWIADTTPPVTTPVNPKGTYPAGSKLALNATDDLAGVKKTYFQINGGAVAEYTGAYTFTTAGTYTITFWSEDEVGNVETKTSIEYKISKSDTTDPDVTPPDAPSVDKPTAGDTTITGTGEPGATVTVVVGGKTIKGKVGADGKFSVKVPALKAGQTVTVTVTDKAGNVSAKTKVKVEATYGLDKPTGERSFIVWIALLVLAMGTATTLVVRRKEQR